MNRPFCISDIPKIISRFTFPWSTPEKTKSRWDAYWKEQEKGLRFVAVVEEKGEIVGYGSLVRREIPEIHDLWIDAQFRNKGLGSSLIQYFEELAKSEGYSEIGMGVGLYKDYGSAQRLYVQLGYIPDGKGISYKGQPVVPGQSYPVDDDLILSLTKKLK